MYLKWHNWVQKTNLSKGYDFSQDLSNDHFYASADADGDNNTDERLMVEKRRIETAVSPTFTQPSSISNVVQDFHSPTYTIIESEWESDLISSLSTDNCIESLTFTTQESVQNEISLTKVTKNKPKKRRARVTNVVTKFQLKEARKIFNQNKPSNHCKHAGNFQKNTP